MTVIVQVASFWAMTLRSLTVVSKKCTASIFTEPPCSQPAYIINQIDEHTIHILILKMKNSSPKRRHKPMSLYISHLRRLTFEKLSS